MSHSLAQIAQAIGARMEGDGDLRLTGAAEPADAGPGDLALAMQPAYADGLAKGRARAAILWEGADWRALGLEGALFAGRPRMAMAHVTRLFDPGPEIAPGVHDSAIVHPDAQLDEGVGVGPFAVIGRGAHVGAGSLIGPHVSVGEDAVLGRDALLHAGVRICARVTVGARLIAQPGAVVGADGLSFVTPDVSGVERARQSLGDQGEIAAQSWVRIHSLGGVVVGDDVELGANACIDRGTIRATRVGSGCKIDNLCHVAHNVVMGRDCLMAGQSGIAGSTVLGDRVVMGGQSGVADNLRIGSDVILGGGTKVLSNVPGGRVMLGYPAVKMDTHVAMYKALRRLPRVIAGLSGAKKAVQKDDPSD